MWVQWGLESACKTALHCCASGLASLALSISTTTSSNSSSGSSSLLVAGLPAPPTALGSTGSGSSGLVAPQPDGSLSSSATAGGHVGLLSTSTSTAAAVQAVAAQAGRAPDVSTMAGRLILSLSMAYMLFATLFLPLLGTWSAT